MVPLPDFIQRVPSCCFDQNHLCPAWDKKVFKIVVDLMVLVVWGGVCLFVGVFWWGGGRERAV